MDLLRSAMKQRYESWFARGLVMLPLLSLAIGLLAWLRYGADIPWFDDWRGYTDGDIDSLSLGHLFWAVNDTLSPVGFALDALAQRYLGGNSVAYQFLSMGVVLGGLLWLQWSLLGRLLDNRLQVAACFFFTVLMLQPGSYWGLENLAYDQALPLLFILGALWLLVGTEGAPSWRAAAVFVLGLLAGLSYISGAFGAFAAGLAFWGAMALMDASPQRRRMMRDSLGLLVAGGLTMTAQFYLSVVRARHATGIPMAFPWEADFWVFYLGKFARSLLLPRGVPVVAALAAIAACALTLGVIVALVRFARREPGRADVQRLAAVVAALGAMVFVYMMLVAAGRTHFRPPEMQSLREVFGHAFTRFHFFWATLLWPWVVAGLIVLARGAPWARRGGVRLAAFVLMGCLAWLVVKGGGFDHMKAQRELARAREPIVRCLLEQLQQGAEIRCPGLLPPRGEEGAPDAYPAYAYAQRIDASFVRYFPVLQNLQRRPGLSPLFQAPAAQLPATDLRALAPGSYEAVSNDPQLHVKTGRPEAMHACTTLEVEAEISPAAGDSAQLFFRPAGQQDYSGENAVTVAIAPAEGPGRRHWIFRASSPTGFEDALRVDPVSRAQRVDLGAVSVYCLWSRR